MKGSNSRFLSVLGAYRAQGVRIARPAGGWIGWLAGRPRSVPLTADADLEQSVAHLNSRQQDMAFLSDIGQLFQACQTVDEVCNVARNRLQTLSPHLSGALYLTSEANEYLRNAMTWGDIEPTQAYFAPGDCWALRCGRPHQVGKGDDAIACAHADPDQGDWHLCLPLMAQGEALGILYFRANARRGRRGHDDALFAPDRLHFYLSVSETLSLAIANIRLRETLQHQAIRDPLTGLFNRRYFQETLRRELHRADRAKQPLSLVMLDIDHFKRFNDTFGHDAGDAALKAVGEILRSRTRAGDVACRYGGEEFALVFPGMPSDAAMARAEAFRREVEAHDIQLLGQTVGPITISAGIAVYPLHAMDIDSLVHAADQALYRSKTGGRNRFTLAVPPRRKTDTASTLNLVHSASSADPDRQQAAGGD